MLIVAAGQVLWRIANQRRRSVPARAGRGGGGQRHARRFARVLIPGQDEEGNRAAAAATFPPLPHPLRTSLRPQAPARRFNERHRRRPVRAPLSQPPRCRTQHACSNAAAAWCSPSASAGWPASCGRSGCRLMVLVTTTRFTWSRCRIPPSLAALPRMRTLVCCHVTFVPGELELGLLSGAAAALHLPHVVDISRCGNAACGAVLVLLWLELARVVTRRCRPHPRRESLSNQHEPRRCLVPEVRAARQHLQNLLKKVEKGANGAELQRQIQVGGALCARTRDFCMVLPLTLLQVVCPHAQQPLPI